MSEYVFNRRVLDDQLIYVEASSLKEAWEKARNDNVLQTSDPVMVKKTLRRIIASRPNQATKGDGQ